MRRVAWTIVNVVGAAASMLMWAFAAFVCTYADSGAPTHPNFAAALPCVVATMTAMALLVISLVLRDRDAPTPFALVVCVVAFVIAPALALASNSDRTLALAATVACIGLVTRLAVRQWR